MGSREVKTALFADDVILFLSDPVNYLQTVIREITEFGDFPGYALTSQTAKF